MESKGTEFDSNSNTNTISNYDVLFKIAIMGVAESGKSSLLRCYVDGSTAYNNNYIPTIGVDFAIKNISVKQTNIKLQIWDLAGQERFELITLSYLRGSNAIIIVYDITSDDSFKSVDSSFKKVHEHGIESNNVVLALVGNKTDLVNERVVSTVDGQLKADEHGALFFETCAKTGQNIAEVFEKIASMCINKIESSKVLAGCNSFEDELLIQIQPAEKLKQKFLKESPSKKLATSNVVLHAKMVIMGSNNGGKTALLTRVTRHTFGSEYDPTIEDSANISLKTNVGDLNLSIFDTVEQERFHSITTSHLRGASIGLIVYDITDRTTFEATKQFAQDFERHNSTDDIVLALVGNKKDLEELRQVSVQEGSLRATELGAIFFETSAKNGSNVDELMKEISKRLVDKRQSRVAPKQKSKLCLLL